MGGSLNHLNDINLKSIIMVRILILLIMYLISMITRAQDLDQANIPCYLSQDNSSHAAYDSTSDQPSIVRPVLFPETEFDTSLKDLTFEKQSVINIPENE
jgi:hypothetical protein